MPHTYLQQWVVKGPKRSTSGISEGTYDLRASLHRKPRPNQAPAIRVTPFLHQADAHRTFSFLPGIAEVMTNTHIIVEVMATVEYGKAALVIKLNHLTRFINMVAGSQQLFQSALQL